MVAFNKKYLVVLGIIVFSLGVFFISPDSAYATENSASINTSCIKKATSGSCSVGNNTGNHQAWRMDYNFHLDGHGGGPWGGVGSLSMCLSPTVFMWASGAACWNIADNWDVGDGYGNRSGYRDIGSDWGPGLGFGIVEMYANDADWSGGATISGRRISIERVEVSPDQIVVGNSSNVSWESSFSDGGADVYVFVGGPSSVGDRSDQPQDSNFNLTGTSEGTIYITVRGYGPSNVGQINLSADREIRVVRGICGDGQVQSSNYETCDQGGNNGRCPRACNDISCRWNNCTSPPVCGNGVPETGEECDSGVNNGGCPRDCSTSCTYNSACFPTPRCSISFNPGNVPTPASVTATWNSQNDSDGSIPFSCNALDDNALIASGNVGAAGSVPVTPPESARCTLTVQNGSLTRTCSAIVTVGSPPTCNLSFAPNIVWPPGSAVLATWTSTGDADGSLWYSCRDGSGVWGSGDIAPGIFSVAILNGSAWVTPGETQECGMEASNPIGTVQCFGSVTIQAPGNININSNVPTTWNTSGPANCAGSGTTGTCTGYPVGSYTLGGYPTTVAYNGFLWDLWSVSPAVTQNLTSGGTITYNFRYIPRPNDLVLSCPSPGTTVNASWTVPPGFNTFYFRAGVGYNNTSPPYAAYDDGVVGNTYQFPSTAGQTYYIWMHTRDPGDGAYSQAVAGNVFCTVPLVNNAAYVAQSVANNMVVGTSQNVIVRMRNTGTTTWTAASNHRLGSQNPVDNNIWGIGRVTLDAGDNIAPGSEKWFGFNITAPAVPGHYNFQWRMLQEAIEWFGGLTDNIDMRVIPPPPTNPGGGCNASGNSATITWTRAATPDYLGARSVLVRAYDETNATWAGWSDYYVGDSYTFPTTPGHSYHWWVHTNYNYLAPVPNNDVYSGIIEGYFPCNNLPDYTVSGNGTAGPVPGPISYGQSVSFFGAVNNSGSLSLPASSVSNTRLRLDIDNNGTWDQTFGINQTNGLAAGTNEVENWNNVWTALVGTHAFEICADINGAINESDEANNCATGTFTVAEALLSCSPANSSIPTNTNTSFTTGGGNGTYSWTAAGGNPAGPLGGLSFTTQWATTGSKTVTVTSGTQTATCNVTVFDVDLSVDQAAITIGTGPQRPTLGWTSDISAVVCNATSTQGDWTGSKTPVVAGSEMVGPYTVPNTYTYTLTCNNGPGGWTDSDSVSVVVSAPTPSIGNGTVTVSNSNYCAAGPHAQVNWTYVPIGNPPQSNQTAYEVVINGGADMNTTPAAAVPATGLNPSNINPEWFISGIGTSTSGGPSSGCNGSNPDSDPQTSLLGGCQLTWNTDYTAWVRVQNGYGVWSPWLRMTSYINGTNPPAPQNFWRTPEHPLPDPDFVFFPANPALNTPVIVTEILPTFDALSDYASRSWYFGDGTARVYQYDGTLPFNVASASHTYVSFRSFDITLRAQDESGVCESTQTVNVQQALPRWREVAPR